MKQHKASPIKSSVAYMIIKVFEKGVAVVSIPIFTRLLSQEQYGLISVYSSWMGLLSAIVVLGFPAGAFNVGLVDFDNDKNKFTSSLLGLTSLLSIIFALFVVVFNNSLSNFMNLPSILLYVMAVQIFFTPAKGFWLLKERFDYRYKLSMVVVIGSGILSLLLSFVAIISVESNQGIAKVIGSAVAATIINIIIYINLLVKGKRIFDLKYWKYGFLFNLPLIPHYLSNLILSQSDKIMISKFSGNVDVSIYAIMYSAASIITIVWASINASLIPWTLKNLSKNNFEYIKKVTRPILIICALTSLGFISLAPELIRIFAPPSYYEGIYIVPPITLGIYYTFVYSLFVNVEYYHKKTAFISIASIGAAVINVVLNLILIPVYGYMAAAYTTLIAYIFYTILHYYAMRITEKNSVYDMKFIVILSFMLTLSSFAMMRIYDYPLLRYASILVGLLILVINHQKVVIVFKSLR